MRLPMWGSDSLQQPSAGWLVAAAMAVVVGSCTTPEAPAGGAVLEKVAGDNQHFIVGRVLPEPIMVKISGKGLAGQFVSFTVTGGGGSVEPAVATPNAGGLVRTLWTLGPSAGTQTLVAFAPGQLLSFTATASAPSPEFADTLIAPGTLPANPKANDALIDSVMVADVGGAPVAGDTVVFTVTEGGGTVNGRIEDSVVTDESGLARFQPWQLGTVAGTNTLRVASLVQTANRPSPVLLTVVTASLLAANRLGIRTAPGGGVSGVAFVPAPVVEIRDSLENLFRTGPGSAATIRAVIASGPAGARLVGKPTAKAVHGVATFDSLAVFGPPGTYQLQFTTLGLASAQSGGISVAVGPVSRYTSTVEVSPTVVQVGATATITLTVRDDYGNPVSGVSPNLISSDSLDGITPPSPTDGLGQSVGSLVPGGPYSTDVIGGNFNGTWIQSATLTVRAPGGSLAFVVQPDPFNHTGTLIVPPAQVAALDATGAVMTGFHGLVTAEAIKAPEQFFLPVLYGTTTVTAVGGVARFTNLHLTLEPGLGGFPNVTLTASSPGLLGGQSAPFNWFRIDDHVIKIAAGGSGNGRVIVIGSGLRCEMVGQTTYGTCIAAFPGGGAPSILDAIPATGSVFVGWGGDCTGVGQCTLPDVRSLWSVTATFK